MDCCRNNFRLNMLMVIPCHVRFFNILIIPSLNPVVMRIQCALWPQVKGKVVLEFRPQYCPSYRTKPRPFSLFLFAQQRNKVRLSESDVGIGVSCCSMDRCKSQFLQRHMRGCHVLQKTKIQSHVKFTIKGPKISRLNRV